MSPKGSVGVRLVRERESLPASSHATFTKWCKKEGEQNGRGPFIYLVDNVVVQFFAHA